MSREPLPSRHAVKQYVPGVGTQTDGRLQQIEQRPNNAPPARDKYCSAAAAMLVALLSHEEAAEKAGGGAEAKLCPKSTLLERAGGLCEQRFLPLSAHVSATGEKVKECRCSAAQQMATLLTLLLVEAKQRKAACPTGTVYKLTDAGRERARQLRLYGEAGEAQPLRHHRRVAPGEAGVVMLLVDEREGGGQAHAKFHALCDALEREGCAAPPRRAPAAPRRVAPDHAPRAAPCRAVPHCTAPPPPNPRRGGAPHSLPTPHPSCACAARSARYETCRLPEGDYLWVEQRAGASGGAVQVGVCPCAALRVPKPPLPRTHGA